MICKKIPYFFMQETWLAPTVGASRFEVWWSNFHSARYPASDKIEIYILPSKACQPWNSISHQQQRSWLAPTVGASHGSVSDFSPWVDFKFLALAGFKISRHSWNQIWNSNLNDKHWYVWDQAHGEKKQSGPMARNFKPIRPMARNLRLWCGEKFSCAVWRDML